MFRETIREGGSYFRIRATPQNPVEYMAVARTGAGLTVSGDSSLESEDITTTSRSNRGLAFDAEAAVRVWTIDEIQRCFERRDAPGRHLIPNPRIA